jgi:uncharacterized membrane protein YkoI
MNNLRLSTLRVPLFFAFLLVLLISANPTITYADIDQATARQLSASGKILPLEKIHEKAKQIKQGKILETELEKKHGQYQYEVELLDAHGIVWEIKLDAATGQLIKLEED